MAAVGEFELLVLLAILRQADAPYANRVREDLEVNAERKVTRGALYRTLDRLASKGLIEWELEPSRIPERGGHPMRRLRVTDHVIRHLIVRVDEDRQVADAIAAQRRETQARRRLARGLSPVPEARPRSASDRDGEDDDGGGERARR